MVALQLIAGFVLLIAGAEILVKGAAKIAASFGISPLVIGLTIVAIGTSSPELAVSVIATINGQTNIAMGNVIGSNIFNILFILGISSLIIPLTVAQQLIRLDVPIMIAASLLALAFAWDGVIRPWEGAVLFTIGVAYTIFVIRLSKKEGNKAIQQEYEEAVIEEVRKSGQKKWLSILQIIAGLAMLVLGSQWLVNSAVAIAERLGVSDLIIGLTIVAVGTSLPEVATSIVAGIRGERDIAVGNAVGSNIFNLLFILGIAAVVGKSGITVDEQALRFDLPVMVATAVASLPLFFTGRKLDRWEGFVFLGYYVAYATYIFMASTQHASLEAFSKTMIWFVMPLTILTMIILVIREIKRRK